MSTVKNKRLFVSDLDGTLLNSQQQLSDRSATLINQAIEQGLQFTYATARSLASSRFVLDQLSISQPIVLYNGAQIYCPQTKRYLQNNHVEAADVEVVMSLIKAANLSPVVHGVDSTGEMRVYFQSINDASTQQWMNSRLANGDKRFRATTDFAELADTQVIEIMAVAEHDKLAALTSALDALPNLHYHLSEDVYYPGYFWLEVLHAKANKGDALQQLKALTGINSTTCFGDNLNDLPMFTIANTAIATANAVEQTKTSACQVIAHHNDDAVAEYLATLNLETHNK